MSRRKSQRVGRFFWRVYLHGLILLLAIVTAVAIVGVLMGHPPMPHLQRYIGRLSGGSAASLPNPAALTEALVREREALGSQITIYRLDGTVLATNAQPPLPGLNHDQIPGLSRGSMRVRLGRWKTATAIPLPSAEHFHAYAVISPSLGPIVERLAAVAFAVLLALAIASIPLARAISAPIERLTQAARSLGEGDLTARSGVKRADEVGQLALAFDEMAERLQRLVQGEQELLANVSHEVRTPLSRIQVALDLALEQPPEQSGAYLRNIESNVRELQRLVDDVLVGARLNMSSGNGGGPSLRLEAVDTALFLSRTVVRFRQRHPDRELKASAAPALPTVVVDPELLPRAVDNLLENAVKYSDVSQPILLNTSATGEQVVIEIRDYGIGIDSSDLPKLFTPFFRTDRSRERGTGGVGLGLLLSKRIVTAHGGSIAVESTPGQGSTFRVLLPIARSVQAEPPEGATSGGESPSARSTKEWR